MQVDFTFGDHSGHFLGALSVDGAAERDAGAEDLLHSAGELNSHRLGSHLLGDVDDVVHFEVSIVLYILLLLSIARAFLQGLDHERSSGGEDSNEALTVLDHQLNLDLDSSPVGGGLLDVFTDLLGGHTERTALGGESGGTGDFATNDLHVD